MYIKQKNTDSMWGITNGIKITMAIHWLIWNFKFTNFPIPGFRNVLIFITLDGSIAKGQDCFLLVLRNFHNNFLKMFFSLKCHRMVRCDEKERLT